VETPQFEDAESLSVSWAALHANNTGSAEEVTPLDKIALLPLFRDEAKSPAMIRHSMDIIRKNVELINPGQTPVIALDQPLYTLAKKIQWNWPESYGEEKFIVMFGGLHIEMGA